jgi:hypothetical protein
MMRLLARTTEDLPGLKGLNGLNTQDLKDLKDLKDLEYLAESEAKGLEDLKGLTSYLKTERIPLPRLREQLTMTDESITLQMPG